MSFFYDLNKRLADLAKKQTLAESAQPVAERATGDYSAKKAAAGKDIGKPGKMFSKIAKSAGKSYGSKAAGERVAGAVLNKLRAKESAEVDESALQAYIGDKKYGKAGMDALRKAGRDGASKDKMSQIRNRYNKMDEADMEEGNEFSGELVKARAQGAKEFNVDGKSYPVKEAGTPMTPKQKSFAKLAPPANKITFADKIAGAKKEVDEMLGDVAAEAIKSAIGKKKESRSKGTAFDPEVAKGMFSREKDKTRTGHDVKDTGYSKRYTKQLSDEPEADNEKSDAPKTKGRPKGSKRAIGAKGPTGRSKLMNKGSIKETDAEYDQEGDMAKDQLHTLAKAAKELGAMLGDDQNLPEWVQSKITKALDYINAVNDYMDQERHDSDSEPVAEKAVSKKQQRFMGMVHAAQKGEKPASKEVGKVAKTMGKKDAKDFATTKHKGLPEKAKAKKTEGAKPDFLDVDKDGDKKESMKKAAGEKKEKKVEETSTESTSSKGGYNFGGSIYESLDRKFRQALTEGMNVTVNMSAGEEGEPRKSITVTADGPEADQLAQLLKMAGMNAQEQESCDTCGNTPCGCESLDENSPDWPTNTETSDNALQYSGGLNGPKSTGQTTIPVVASQLRRQVSMEEGAKLERNLLDLYQEFKTK